MNINWKFLFIDYCIKNNTFCCFIYGCRQPQSDGGAWVN